MLTRRGFLSKCSDYRRGIRPQRACLGVTGVLSMAWAGGCRLRGLADPGSRGERGEKGHFSLSRIKSDLGRVALPRGRSFRPFHGRSNSPRERPRRRAPAPQETGPDRHRQDGSQGADGSAVDFRSAADRQGPTAVPRLRREDHFDGRPWDEAGFTIQVRHQGWRQRPRSGFGNRGIFAVLS
jgi:hypothetical protein